MPDEYFMKLPRGTLDELPDEYQKDENCQIHLHEQDVAFVEFNSLTIFSGKKIHNLT